MRNVIIVLTIMMLSGCGPRSYETSPRNVSGNRASSKFITRVENCDIYQLDIEHVNSFLYLAKCSDVSTAEIDINHGKNNSRHGRLATTTDKSSVEYTADEKELLVQANNIQRKYQLLNKLSEEDKIMLGIKTKE